jgi:hypothetical protein
LLRHYLNGDIPHLDALIDLCGEHYLLQFQLQEIKAFPTLHTDLQDSHQPMTSD